MYELYRQKYITEINRYRYDNTIFRPDQVYERLWALAKNHILWTDIPPGFEDTYKLPHRNDYGVDSITLDFSETGQMKFYGPESTITWKAISTFNTYSKEILGIDNLLLLTTPEAKIDSMVQRLFINNPERIERKSFDELMLLVPENEKQEGNDSNNDSNNDINNDSCVDIEAREYQTKTVKSILENPKPTIKVEWCCGLGKTFLSMLLHQTRSKDEKRVDLFITPWRPLAHQVLKECEYLGIKAGMIGDNRKKVNPEWQFIIVIYNSIPRLSKTLNVRYKFGDEAHHLENPEGEFTKRFNDIKAEKTILLSATFDKTDDIDNRITIRDGINLGYITDYKLHFCHYTGDRTNALLKLVKEGNGDWYPLFIYFNSVENAKSFCKLLIKNGVAAAFIIGTTSTQKRDEVKQKIRDGLISVVCLKGVWNEGESVHELRTVMFGDLRFSTINVRQVSQRCSRKHKNKPYYNVVIPIEESVWEDMDEETEMRTDVKRLLKIFSEQDQEVKKAIENRSYSRICVRKNNEIVREEDDKTSEASLLYTRIFDSMGELISDSRLAVEQKIEELLSEKEVPSRGKNDTKFTDGKSSKGWFWANCKSENRCYKAPYDRLLTNTVIRADWERYQKEKKEKEGKSKLTVEQKIEELLREKEVPSQGKNDTKFTDGVSKGWFWNGCKIGNKCYKAPYDRLLTNPVFRADWERYQQEKKEKEGKSKLTVEQKIEELLSEKEVPSRGKNNTKFTDGKSSKGWFWNNCKIRNTCYKAPYDRLLTNPVFRVDWERNHQEKKQ